MRTIKLVAVALLAAVLGWEVLHALRAGWFEYHLFHLPRTTPAMPADSAQLGLTPVVFPSADGTELHGWYIASANGAAVVLAGGSSSDRTNMLEHARALRGTGLGLLLFDWPGTGESGGRIGIGPAERAAVRGAANFVAAQPGVRTGRLGLVGFSLGAHAGLLVAADDPRIRAVAVEGAFDDFGEQARIEYADASPLTRWGALAGARLGGMEAHGPDVRAAAARMAPRPLLFVSGTEDHLVPPVSTRRVFNAALPPKQFLLVKGAGHGGYLKADTTHAQRLRQFMTEALVTRDSSTRD